MVETYISICSHCYVIAQQLPGPMSHVWLKWGQKLEWTCSMFRVFSSAKSETKFWLFSQLHVIRSLLTQWYSNYCSDSGKQRHIWCGLYKRLIGHVSHVTYVRVLPGWVESWSICVCIQWPLSSYPRSAWDLGWTLLTCILTVFNKIMLWSYD